MPEDASKLTCEEFQRQIPELFTSRTDLFDHPHVVACATCHQLLQELRTIAERSRYRFPSSDDWPDFT